MSSPVLASQTTKSFSFLSKLGSEIDKKPIKEITLSLSVVPNLHTHFTDLSPKITHAKLISLCTEVTPFYKQTFFSGTEKYNSDDELTLDEINTTVAKLSCSKESDANDLVLRVFIFAGHMFKGSAASKRSSDTKSLPDEPLKTSIKKREKTPYCRNTSFTLKSLIEEKLFVLPDLSQFEQAKIILKNDYLSINSVAADIEFDRFYLHMNSIYLVHENESMYIKTIETKEKSNSEIQKEQTEEREFNLTRFKKEQCFLNED